MPRWEPEQIVSQSVLERLIDPKPKSQSETQPTRAQSVRQLKASVRRDLEWLLNTRRTPEPAGSEYPDLERSLFNYGLPDLTSLNWQSSRDRIRLARALELAVSIFEPRLKGVRISMEQLTGLQHILKFQIEGMLQMDPAPEHISFDTVLQLANGEYEVKGDAGAG